MNAVLSLSDVIKVLEHNIEKLRSFGIKKLGVFGSIVKGEHRQSSDLDFLVEFKDGEKNFDNYMGLLFFLEDLFKLDVDLVIKRALSPHIGPSILKEVVYIV